MNVRMALMVVQLMRTVTTEALTFSVVEHPFTTSLIALAQSVIICTVTRASQLIVMKDTSFIPKETIVSILMNV